MTRTTLALLTLLSAPALAQDEAQVQTETQEVRYKARTEIEFDGVGVNGELTKPQGVLLADVKRASFKPLIELRLDFNREIERSVVETH